jgi:4a-hydroxytetrahydrobiopterin dehydratase
MITPEGGADRRLSRQEASDAVSGLGWRYILGFAQAFVRTGSLARGTEAAAKAAAAAGEDGHSLLLDIRPERLVLTVQSPAAGGLTGREAEVARRVSAALGELGLVTEPGTGDPGTRSVQGLEIAIDAIDIPAIVPFWQAVLGYGPEPGASGPVDALVDPLGQGPAIWFQQMDAPRPQRNRIHFDISVPHDEAARRIEAALAAGGKLVSGDAAPAFWVLADAEGNEACVCTWQGRDG